MNKTQDIRQNSSNQKRLSIGAKSFKEAKCFKLLNLTGFLFWIGAMTYSFYITYLIITSGNDEAFFKKSLQNFLISIGIGILVTLIQATLFYCNMKENLRKRTEFCSGLLKLGIINFLIVLDLSMIVNEVFKNTLVIVPEGLMIRTVENIPMGFFMFFNAYVDMRIAYWAISDLKFFSLLTRGKIALGKGLVQNKSMCGWLAFVMTGFSFIVIYLTDIFFEFNLVRGGLLGAGIGFVVFIVKVVKKRFRIVIN